MWVGVMRGCMSWQDGWSTWLCISVCVSTCRPQCEDLNAHMYVHTKIYVHRMYPPPISPPPYTQAVEAVVSELTTNLLQSLSKPTLGILQALEYIKYLLLLQAEGVDCLTNVDPIQRFMQGQTQAANSQIGVLVNGYTQALSHAKYVCIMCVHNMMQALVVEIYMHHSPYPPPLPHYIQAPSTTTPHFLNTPSCIRHIPSHLRALPAHPQQPQHSLPRAHHRTPRTSINCHHYTSHTTSCCYITRTVGHHVGHHTCCGTHVGRHTTDHACYVGGGIGNIPVRGRWVGFVKKCSVHVCVCVLYGCQV